MEERLETFLCMYHRVKIINAPSYPKSKAGRQTQWSDGRQFNDFIVVKVLANAVGRGVKRIIYYARHVYRRKFVCVGRSRTNEADKVLTT